jgi:PAS domain S-box-containing protein
MVLAHDLEPSLGAVLKTALDAVVVMRFDGTIAGWNDVAAETFGWTFAEVRDLPMSEFIIPPRHREAHERGLVHHLATGEGPILNTRFEIEALHRDGHEMPIELSITPTTQFGEVVFLGFLRDITERRAAAQRQAVLVAELNHRAKNLLAVVSGIAHMTLSASTSLDEFETAFIGRLQSLDQAHEILTAASWERAAIGKLAETLLKPYIADGRASIAGPQVMLGPRQFLSLGMILHELITNGVRFGALSTLRNRLALSWTQHGEDIAIEWVEACYRPVSAPVHQGFGTQMIALGVRHELKGESEYEWRPDGLTFRLRFKRI